MSIAAQYTYRQLTIEDVKLLKELLRVFGHAFNDSETYQHAIPSDEYFTNLLGRTGISRLSEKSLLSSCIPAGGQVTTHTHFTDGILRAGLNYKFY